MVDQNFLKVRKFSISIFLFLISINFSFAENLNFEKIVDLNDPWGSTFISSNELLITEKSGKIKLINLNSKQVSEVNHDLNYLEHGQGGLLDIIYKDNFIYISYTENRGNWKTSTSIAKAKFNKKNLIFENIFQANPPIDSGYHFGSRLVIKDNYLYATAGERNEGMIAQDPTKHPGSIIRIKTNGKIPTDNPKFTGKKEWLPEIYAIGVRNPQGITVSPHNNKIYFSNHGPRGGDHIAQLKSGANYGWKDIAWGGTKYSGFSIGKVPFKKKYDKPIKTWVPSIAISSIQFYNGDVFLEWKGDLIVCSLSGKSLIRLDYENNKILDEEIIFKNKIGRIRDFKVDKEGNIFLINDRKNAELWKLTR